MTAEKPSEGARMAAILATSILDTSYTPGQQTEVALAIDREAVAPAVQNLVAILDRIQKRAKAHPDDTDEDRKRMLYHIESLASQALSRYSHIIEGEGE